MDENLNAHVVRLDERVNNIMKAVSDIQLDQKGQNAKLDMLVAAENQRKGAKAISRVLLGVVTSGGFLGWLWEHFHK